MFCIIVIKVPIVLKDLSIEINKFFVNTKINVFYLIYRWKQGIFKLIKVHFIINYLYLKI